MGTGPRLLPRLWHRLRDLKVRCGRRWRNWRRSMRLREGRGMGIRGHSRNLTGEGPVAPWVAVLLAVLVAGFLAGAASAQTNGQPVPELNFVSDSNNGAPQQTQLYVPFSFESQYLPVKAGSVPALRATWNCSGDNCCFHSASVFVILSGISLSRNTP